LTVPATTVPVSGGGSPLVDAPPTWVAPPEPPVPMVPPEPPVPMVPPEPPVPMAPPEPMVPAAPPVPPGPPAPPNPPVLPPATPVESAPAAAAAGAPALPAPMELAPASSDCCPPAPVCGVADDPQPNEVLAIRQARAEVAKPCRLLRYAVVTLAPICTLLETGANGGVRCEVRRVSAFRRAVSMALAPGCSNAR